MSLAPDHNGPQWLEVRHLGSAARGPEFHAGWYVVRCCPCHDGERVTLPYPDAGRAALVRRILLGLVTTRSVPRLVWEVAA